MGCCEPVLAPVENYYTKYQIDKMIASAVTSGCCITPEEVDEKIEEAISGISVSGVTEEELNNAIASAKTEIEAEIPTVPTKVSAFENDVPYLTEHQSLSGYATEQWVSSFTYDKATIDEKVAEGGTFDPTQYYNKTATNALLDEKLDVTAYTPTDLSNYYNKQEVNNIVESAKTEVEAEIPTVPTSNTAFTNDAGYLTEHQSLSGYATEQWVLDKNYITGVDLSNYATKDEIPTVPTKVSAFENDVPYLTEHQSLSGYVTDTEMSAYTYDKQTIDDKIAQGGTFDPSQYYNTAQTNNLIESAVTRVEGEIPSLSGYATEQWVLDKNYITGVDLSNYATKAEIPTVPTSNTAFTNDAGYLTEHQSLSGYATEQWVEDKHYITGVDLSDYALKSEIPTVPTSNTAFTNDAGYLTEHQSLTAYSTTNEVNELINQSVSGKQDTLSAGTNITIVDNVISATGGGGGITSGEVQTMIDENISGKASVNDAIKNLTFKAYSAEDAVHGMLNVTLVKCNGTKTTMQEVLSAGSGITITRNIYGYANISFDDRVVSGKADSSTVSALTNTVTAHTASTSVHVTSTEKNTWNNKVDSSTLNNYLLKSKIWCGTQNEYDSIQNKDSETLYLIHE